MICNRCGVENVDSDRFCIACGSKLDREVMTGNVVVASSTCSSCGTINDASDKFCIVCGNKLGQIAQPVGTSTATITATPVPPSPPVSPPVSVPPSTSGFDDDLENLFKPNAPPTYVEQPQQLVNVPEPPAQLYTSEDTGTTKNNPAVFSAKILDWKNWSIKSVAVIISAVVLVGAVIWLLTARPWDRLSINAGDAIRFGGYDWHVLDVQRDMMLIITSDILELRAYHNSLTNITWADSQMRAYLNDVFYSSFEAEDRNRIIQTDVITNNNPWYGTEGGIDTRDYIFLLSYEEVVEYFGDSGELSNRPRSEYADADGLFENFDATRRDWMGDGYADILHDQYNANRVAYKWADRTKNVEWWWLRSSGIENIYAGFVYTNGAIYMIGGDVNSEFGGVRPAMWLSR